MAAETIANTRVIALSGALHLAVLLPLLLSHRARLQPIVHPGTLLGSRITLNYSPGRPAAQAAVATQKPKTARPKSIPQHVSSNTVNLASGAAAPPATSGESTSGNSSAGSGNVTVALATYFPWPRPDLSELSHGTRGDVIVDITIDENGKIITSRLSQGLAQNIDRAVLAIIETWVFKPATKDGVAVPSEQELLFHYERG